ncbi:hypothetical protein LX36DRAFT_208821 [Colletotrichum falcatum]|nr:hypothetical protein LX36DRAFT_208821 [Colletotrichum falcatum]
MVSQAWQAFPGFFFSLGRSSRGEKEVCRSETRPPLSLSLSLCVCVCVFVSLCLVVGLLLLLLLLFFVFIFTLCPKVRQSRARSASHPSTQKSQRPSLSAAHGSSGLGGPGC